MESYVLDLYMYICMHACTWEIKSLPMGLQSDKNQEQNWQTQKERVLWNHAATLSSCRDDVNKDEQVYVFLIHVSRYMIIMYICICLLIHTLWCVMQYYWVACLFVCLHRGASQVLLKPKTTEEVSKILAYCHSRRYNRTFVCLIILHWWGILWRNQIRCMHM